MGSRPPPPPRRRRTRPPAITTRPSITGDDHHHEHHRLPAVSTPATVSAHEANYTVAGSSYSLNIAATIGECWVEVTNPANGSVLFTTTLLAGQSHTIAATGPVTVIAGAPGAFTATIDGAPVTLPPGNQAPFTLHFLTASSTPTRLATTVNLRRSPVLRSSANPRTSSRKA